MELELIKKHMRVMDDFEDDAIEMYVSWAESKVKDSVTNEDMIYDLFFNNNTHYKRAVILLTAHYFQNRLPLTDKPQYNLAFGLQDALTQLEIDFLHYLKEIEQDEQ